MTLTHTDDQDQTKALAKEAWLAYRLAFESMHDAHSGGDAEAFRQANFARIDAETALQLVQGAMLSEFGEASIGSVFEPPGSLPILELQRRVGRTRALLDALLRFSAEANGDAVAELGRRMAELDDELARRG